LARGVSRSSSIEQVIKSAEEIGSMGVKEIVLTGVNIGDFNNDKGENFLQLIKALDKTEGIERFRISSIEPNLLTNEIIEFVADSQKFVPHFHIPLQSGSDEILNKMRRRYKRNLYEERIFKIKELMPECCIGADVIVGFPGETEENFSETFQFINELPVSYLHVFSYSERPNTTAVRMKGRVPNAVRSDRNKMLSILSEKKKRYFYEEQIGKEFTVLWENERQGEYMHGFTENYLKIKAPYSSASVNCLEKVKLKKIDSDGMITL
jgi:threonylcarbamoyladenosine tRNA methylthiotransferase MtaB